MFVGASAELINTIPLAECSGGSPHHKRMHSHKTLGLSDEQAAAVVDTHAGVDGMTVRVVVKKAPLWMLMGMLMVLT